MNSKVERILERVEALGNNAERILEGIADNYDGADGARLVSELCEYIKEMAEIIKEDEGR